MVIHISAQLRDVTVLHPRLLWDDISAETVAVLSETSPHPPFLFTLTLQHVPGFGTDQLRLALHAEGIAIEHVR
jgi:hypothetical protein